MKRKAVRLLSICMDFCEVAMRAMCIGLRYFRSIKQCGAGLINTLSLTRSYVQKSRHSVEESIGSWSYFESSLTYYLREKSILSSKGFSTFPEYQDVKVRDKFIESVSLSEWGVASGHGNPIIAYDATLESGDDWIDIYVWR